MADRKRRAQDLYTYRCGELVRLSKRPNQFVVRRLPQELPASMSGAEQMSTASSRVTCEPEDLDDLMVTAREVAPAHHAYDMMDTGEAFLITDRIIVTFKEPLSVEAVGTFAGRYALDIVEKISDVDYLVATNLFILDERGCTGSHLAVS